MASCLFYVHRLLPTAFEVPSCRSRPHRGNGASCSYEPRRVASGPSPKGTLGGSHPLPR